MRTWKGSWIRLNCNKVLSLIGLSTKAGKIVSDENLAAAMEKQLKSE